MATLVFSDTHIGASSGADIARIPSVRERLLEAVEKAERVVALGDLIELRERPVPEILRRTRPFFDALAEPLAGKRLTLVPGNHDHDIAQPWLAQGRLEKEEASAESDWPVEPGDGIAGRIASLLPGAEVRVAYPGLRIRPDVYATHGHYLDLRLTIPRPETIFAAVVGKMTKLGREPHSAAGYEAVMSPMYDFHHALAQSVSEERAESGSGMSRRVWARATGSGPRGFLTRAALGKVAIPAGVAALNKLGLGPFNPEISAVELRRTGLRAMAEVVSGLGVEADHVIFGHTHRRGPGPGDELSEWVLPGGGQLWNTGSWYYERILLGKKATDSPYWPGTVIWIEDEGPPRLENLLREGFVFSDSRELPR